MSVERKPKKKRKLPRLVWCDNCDGCGWYEGGKTLQTRCEKCKGTGKVTEGEVVP